MSLDANTVVERMRARRRLTAATRRHRAAGKSLAELESYLGRYEASGKAHKQSIEDAQQGALRCKNEQSSAQQEIDMLRELLA